MSGIMGYLTLESQILLINVLDLAISILTWGWLKWDQQLEKIWNLSVSQSNELDVKNINWLKTTLSWIVGARLVINRVSILAYGANVYTIVVRSWQHLLIFWMVLSFLKDIILEVVVIIITFLLWYKGNVVTSLFVEFVAGKTIRLLFFTYKWYTTLKWHTYLRKVEKIRKFTIIARRSIANIIHAPGKVRISLQDEYLSPAIARRNKYASLLDVFSNESLIVNRVNFDLGVSKSLTTLATNDSHDLNDTNNHDPIVNDLSVAEKSMKMLNITAEDVMDARARILERPYWNEQNVTPEASMDEVMSQFFLEKVEDKNGDHALKEKDTVRNTAEKKRKEDESSLTDNKEEILSRKQEENTSLVTSEKARKKVERAVKIVQCPSSEEDMQAKPCASFIRKLEAKPRSISVNQKEKEVDQKMHPSQVKTKSTPASSNLNKEEFDKNPETCACRHVSRNMYTSKNEKHARSIDINDKSVKHDIDKKEFKRFVSTGITQKGKVNENNSTLKYSEIYRLKKQIKKSEDSFKKQSLTWESMPVARTAHVSGYTKNITIKTDKISVSPTETFDESNDSLNARHKLKYFEHMRSRPSADLSSIFEIASLRRKNYTESEAYNDLTVLKNKRGTKMRKTSNHKLSIEEREVIKGSALRICNEFPLLEDKKELEAEKKRNLSSNHKQTIKMSKIKVLGADLTLLRNKKEVETTRRLNLSPSYKQSIEESNTLKTRNKLVENTREQARKIRNPMKYETSKYEETSSVSNFSETNREDTTISLSETHRNANARTLLNLREITRNIEWTIHPRGITLINKNLYSQFLENGSRFHESRQRDIVDDNIANTVHSAYFFKPEITTRIFRRTSPRIGKSFPNIPTFLREDFNTEFVCRVNNEMIVRDHFSFFDLDFERMMGDQNNLENSHNSENAEENHDLCTIFVDPEQAPIESETGIENSTEVIRPQEDARPNILTFDENLEQIDNRTSDNLPVQSNIVGLKSFYVEMPEIEERGNISHAIGDNSFRTQKLNKNSTSSDEENDNEHYRILDHIADIDKTINDQSVHSFDDSATSSLSDNNQLNILIDKPKKISINCNIENSSKLSLPGPSSFIESDNYDTLTLKSSEEKFQKLTQLSDSETTLENRSNKSVLNLGITDDDTILQFEDVETLKSKTMENSAKSEDENKEIIYEKAHEFSTDRFFRMSSVEKLQQDDSYYSIYEGNDNRSNTLVSLENGSIMEEFSNDIPLEQSSSSANNSRQSQ